MIRGTTSSTRTGAIGRLFDVAREGIYIGVLNSADAWAAGSAVVVNPFLKRVLGYAPDTDDSSVLLFSTTHYMDQSSRERLITALFGDGGVSDYLVQLKRCDGSAVWVEITAHTEVEFANVVQVHALVRDVSDRRSLEERARDLYQQLAHSEQLAAINRTLAEVAHELRNPLATIVAWAERLSQATLDDRTAKGVSEILSAAERASRIIRSALHSSNRQPSTRALVDVNGIIEETLALRQHDQRSMNINARAELDAKAPAILADAHQIQQILLNIIMNAEQAMSSAHDRGTLTIRTSADERRQMVIVEVSDDGPGIPESVRSRVFDPFFTTKQSRSGTGLGLAVAQALAHEHGGSIRLAHERAEGATFVLELPTRDLPTAIAP